MVAYPTYKGDAYTIYVDNDRAAAIANKAQWDEANSRWLVYKPYHTTLANALWTVYTGEKIRAAEGPIDKWPKNPSTQFYDYTKEKLTPYFKRDPLKEAVEEVELAINKFEEALLDAGPLRPGESDFEKAAKFNSEEDLDDDVCSCGVPFRNWEEDEEGNLTCPGCGYTVGKDEL